MGVLLGVQQQRTEAGEQAGIAMMGKLPFTWGMDARASFNKAETEVVAGSEVTVGSDAALHLHQSMLKSTRICWVSSPWSDDDAGYGQGNGPLSGVQTIRCNGQQRPHSAECWPTLLICDEKASLRRYDVACM